MARRKKPEAQPKPQPGEKTIAIAGQVVTEVKAPPKEEKPS